MHAMKSCCVVNRCIYPAVHAHHALICARLVCYLSSTLAGANLFVDVLTARLKLTW